MAVEFAYRFVDQYDHVWWIPAEPRVRRAGRAESIQAPLVIDALGTTGLKWLLVYDNADKPEDPPGPGRVRPAIQTSRNQTWSPACDAIEVNIFDRDESIAPAPRTPITVALVMLEY